MRESKSIKLQLGVLYTAMKNPNVAVKIAAPCDGVSASAYHRDVKSKVIPSLMKIIDSLDVDGFEIKFKTNGEYHLVFKPKP